jgi:3-phosphoshikimate 1-carboxyvinyltransferase
MISRPVNLDVPDLELAPVASLSGDVYLPGSKSISNRALLLAALADGTTRIHNLLKSDDTERMLTALTTLGVPVRQDGEDVLVNGRAGPLVTAPMTATLDLGLAGTALRPLAAALTLGAGRFILDGTARMRERPVAHLVDGLRQLGARIDYLGQEGYPPIAVSGTGLSGGQVQMAGNISSQFLTSLLLSAPLAAGPVMVDIVGEQVSKPYLDITLHMMRRFGAAVAHEDHQRFIVQPGGYRSPGEYLVEGDASSASYFLAAGAISGKGITVHGIGADSVQGDVAFVQVLKAMGARVDQSADSIHVAPGPLIGVDLDLNHIPDAAMTVAVLAGRRGQHGHYAPGGPQIGHHRHLRRSSHGHVLRPGEPGRRVRGDHRPGLRAQNLSRLLRRLSRPGRLRAGSRRPQVPQQQPLPGRA